jgi:L-ribulose-5-phosphate 3-epimerase
MKKGINAGCFPRKYEVTELFQKAKEFGYDGVELNIHEEKEALLSLNSTEEDLYRISELAKQNGIELPSVSTTLHWKYSLTDNDETIQEKGIKIIEKMLKAADIFGSKTILVVPGVVSSEVPYDIAYQRSLRALKKVSKTAEHKNVRIGVENVWNKFLLSPLEMANFIDEIGSPWVGAYFDVGNVLQFGYPEQWIKILNDRILAVHVKDYKTNIGNARAFSPLLTGDVAWDEVSKALQEIGYNGYISPELQPYSLYPDRLLIETSNTLDTIFMKK